MTRFERAVQACLDTAAQRGLDIDSFDANALVSEIAHALGVSTTMTADEQPQAVDMDAVRAGIDSATAIHTARVEKHAREYLRGER